MGPHPARPLEATRVGYLLLADSHSIRVPPWDDIAAQTRLVEQATRLALSSSYIAGTTMP